MKAKLELSCRIFHCDGCGLTLDRDMNAAINLKNQAVLALEYEAEELREARTPGPLPTILPGLRPESQPSAVATQLPPCTADNGDR